MSDEASIRLDKWLWAARFFKTRRMAAEAIQGGKVHINRDTAKPAKPVKPGDRLRITKGQARFEVVVEAVSGKRGPAKQAEKLYTETEESVQRREREAEIRRMERMATPIPERRPDKKDRRKLREFKKH